MKQHRPCFEIVRQLPPRTPEAREEYDSRACRAAGVAAGVFALLFLFTRHWLPAALAVASGVACVALAMVALGARYEREDEEGW